MPSTRPLLSFEVRTTTGDVITIQRRCHGTGKPVQKQLSQKIYDAGKKKFRAPTDEERKKWYVTPASPATSATAKAAPKN